MQPTFTTSTPKRGAKGKGVKGPGKGAKGPGKGKGKEKATTNLPPQINISALNSDDEFVDQPSRSSNDSMEDVFFNNLQGLGVPEDLLKTEA